MGGDGVGWEGYVSGSRVQVQSPTCWRFGKCSNTRVCARGRVHAQGTDAAHTLPQPSTPPLMQYGQHAGTKQYTTKYEAQRGPNFRSDASKRYNSSTKLSVKAVQTRHYAPQVHAAHLQSEWGATATSITTRPVSIFPKPRRVRAPHYGGWWWGGAASARSDNCYCRELPAALCGCCRGSPSAAVCCCCWLWCLGPGCDWRCTTHPAAPAACGCCAGGSAAAHCCWGHRHHHWCCPSLLCQSPPPAPPQARPADPVPTPTPSHFSATQTRDHPLPSHSHHPPSHSPRTPSHYQPPPLP